MRTTTLDNRISLQKLEVFCLVVQLGSVSRAADKLFVTQPVVSSHIHSLQERVGAQLFRRQGRGIELTEAGEAVHAWAEDLLRRREDLAEQLDDLAIGTAGSVTVGSSMSVGNYLLPPTLIDFRRRYPDARITLSISNPELAVEAVRVGASDFCLIAATSSLDAEVFLTELVGRQRFALIAAADDTSIGDSVTLDELRELPFVCPPGGLSIRRSQDAALASMGITSRNVAIELGSAESMKQAVIAQVGVALLWEASIRPDLEAGTVREVTMSGPEIFDHLYMVSRRNKVLTPLQRKLYDELAEVAQASTSQQGGAEPR